MPMYEENSETWQDEKKAASCIEPVVHNDLTILGDLSFGMLSVQGPLGSEWPTGTHTAKCHLPRGRHKEAAARTEKAELDVSHPDLRRRSLGHWCSYV